MVAAMVPHATRTATAAKAKSYTGLAMTKVRKPIGVQLGHKGVRREETRLKKRWKKEKGSHSDSVHRGSSLCSSII